MRTMFADIEADDLKATVLHCICCEDLETKEEFTFRQEECYTKFPEFAKTVGHWIGHNFLSYDAPTLNRLAGTNITTSQITDTLILSKMDRPDRETPKEMALLPPAQRKGPHSLMAWGQRMGDCKLEFTDFKFFSEEMVTYCRQDTKMLRKIYAFLMKRLEKCSPESIRMEHTVRMIMNRQKINGIAFDVNNAELLEAELREELVKAEEEVHQTMKPLAKFIKEVTPQYKKDGTMSIVGLKSVHEDPLNVVGGPFSLIDFPEFNLGSRDQVAAQLIRKGWKPEKFTPTGKPIIDEPVLEEVEFPEGKLIYRYMMLQKRITDVKKWIRFTDPETGLIHADVDSLGANTNRMTHSEPNLSQVTSNDKPYGKQCRSLFIPRSSDRVLVGADASGLEARCLAHRINDPEFTNGILESDVHTFNQHFFGLSTRKEAKPAYYCLVYGGGDAKFGSVVGGGAKEGKVLREKYYKRFPNLERIQKAYGGMQDGGRMFGIDGRILNIRSAHSALNLDLQSMGAIICKYWMVQIATEIASKRIDAIQILQVHDELQFDVRKDHVERFIPVIKNSMKYVEKLLKMNCPLDCDVTIGNNWSETH